ncbi:MAG: hypothetical protein HY609_04980 [Deltaproteobacteria bacterium]|nr:hypothetical protein [Deltaproteobacteria bacterium]MBI4224266.1 hypothetical protein [Deltaproteobacteria bacterium]
MSYKRIAIADRSVLAHNVYETLLKPEGYSLFPYQTLKELKEHLHFDWGIQLLLVSSNTFGKYFDQHYKWFLKEKGPCRTAKIFLCETGEKKWAGALKKLPKSQIVWKPFYPPELEEKISRIAG